MIQDQERVKSLLELRKRLKESVRGLETALVELRGVLDRLEEMLLGETLVTGETIARTGVARREDKGERVVRVRAGETEIGRIIVDMGAMSMTFFPAPGVHIPADAKPISSFLGRKVVSELKGSQPSLLYSVERGDEEEVRKIFVSNLREEQINDLIGKLIWAIRESATR